MWKAALRGLLEDSSRRHAAIAAPTLLVWGEQDAMVPAADQDALLAAIPGAQLIVHRGGGHAFHWEDPARYAAEVSAFIAAL